MLEILLNIYLLHHSQNVSNCTLNTYSSLQSDSTMQHNACLTVKCWLSDVTHCITVLNIKGRMIVWVVFTPRWSKMLFKSNSCEVRDCLSKVSLLLAHFDICNCGTDAYTIRTHHSGISQPWVYLNPGPVTWALCLQAVIWLDIPTKASFWMRAFNVASPGENAGCQL